MRLVVAPWGWPWGWRSVNYRLGGCSVGGVRCSLSCILRCIGGDDARVLVIVADSLITGLGVDEAGSVAGYGDIVSRVEKLVDDWINGLGDGDDVKAAYREGRLVVRVTPNIGFYQGRRDRSTGRQLTVDARLSLSRGLVDAISPLGLYMSYVLYYILEELLGGGESFEELVLDTSHGVNFMPLAVFNAARLAALAYAASRGSGIGFTVYNSEPVVGSPPSRHVFNVHRVFSAEYGAADAARLLAYEISYGDRVYLLKQAGKLEEELQHRVNGVRSEARRLYGEALPAVGIYKACAALAAAYYAADHGDGGAFLGKALGVLREALRVSRDAVSVGIEDDGGRAVVAEWRLVPRVDGFERLVAAAALADYIVEAGSAARGGDGFTIDELDSVVGRICSPNCFTSLNEHDRIAGRLRAGEPYIAFAVGSWPGEGCMYSSMDVRNFVAHGGLERNLVEARVDDGVVRLRYREGCWRKVREGVLVDVAIDKYAGGGKYCLR